MALAELHKAGDLCRSKWVRSAPRPFLFTVASTLPFSPSLRLSFPSVSLSPPSSASSLRPALYSSHAPHRRAAFKTTKRLGRVVRKRQARHRVPNFCWETRSPTLSWQSRALGPFQWYRLRAAASSGRANSVRKRHGQYNEFLCTLAGSRMIMEMKQTMHPELEASCYV